jgi:hypothetical protein
MRYYFINQDMKEFSIDVELKNKNVFEFSHDGEKKDCW